MARLSISYFPEGATESRMVYLPDAEGEPEIAALVKAAKDDLAKIEAMVAWFARNPRKLERVDLSGVDEPSARRMVKTLAAPVLKLSVEKMKGDWLVEYAGLLEDLEIDDLTAFDIPTFAKLPKLKRLGLWHVEAFDLSFLSTLSALEELKLGGFEKVMLPRLPRVKTLNLNAASVAAGGLAGLSGLTYLRVDEVRLGDPGALPALETLRYEGHREPLPAKFFKSMPALKSVGGNLLNLPEDDNLVKLDVLAPCTAIEEIDFSTRKVSGLGVLAKLPRLTSLSLSGETPAEIDLAKLPVIRTIKAFGELTLKNIEKAPKLVELAVTTIADLAPLAGCADLERITVHNGKGLSLKPLAGLAKLKSIDLGYDTRPSAKMIEPVATKEGLTINSKLGYLDVAELYGELTGKIKVAKQADFPRPAFSLKGKKGDPGGTKSHSFGTPYLAPGEKWPVCGSCKKSMPCLLQLDLKSLKGWKGFLQVFYCTNTEPKQCEVECKTWEGPGPSMHLRIVTPGKKSSAVAPADLPKTKAQALTVDAKATADIPGQDDAEELGVKDSPREPKMGDKLGGWPYWMQGPEWPACPDCKKKMTVLVQLASNKAVDHQWGDLGYAHVFACDEHRERLGFCWASG